MVQARGNDVHPWVQPIVVSKTGTHERTVELAATASLRVRKGGLSPVELQAFEEWLSGPFTKTVRRASEAQFDAAVRWAENSGQAYSVDEDGDSRALALAPLLYEEMPKELARLQVAGTDLPRRGDVGPVREEYDYTLLVLDSLTTGKAAAQAAHGLWARALKTGLDGASLSFRLRFVAAEELEEWARRYPAYAVRDKGLTEIEANTLTALALP